MDNKRTYSIADIARELQRPRSTVAYWIETFSAYLPSVGSGRTKRFKQEALENLKLIMRMKDQSEPNELVEELLRETTSEIVIVPEEEKDNGFFNEIADSYKSVLAHMQAQEERFEERLRVMEEKHEKQLSEALKASDEVAGSLERIEQKLEDRDKLLIGSMRQLQEDRQKEKEERSKGFLQRLFSK
jgi:DNA-binding transcriptional MerR regulator